MMILIIGGSGSGKSSYAEKTALTLAEKEGQQTEERRNTEIRKYYLATMKVYDEEGRKKVMRHQKMRAGKGFLTIEQPTDIAKALEKMEAGTGVVLLECLSNLTANEMFTEEDETVRTGVDSEIRIAEKIVQEISVIKECMTHLVVVGNNVFEDGILYDETTMSYIRVLGHINRKLAIAADEVIEVAAGIPVILKKNLS
ncbi:MAG: bifunctional adenosylcobinamide kinase/adenosylcobinamide-phosphate guanylyltransferase [Ruminococcus sp.]|nr:bifunctional adenosylcobinamide kinase/adenosylcobinamide-phosphate guanylyltransferase [Ruminococcus sp.]